MTHICNSSTSEAEAEDCPNLRVAWATKGVPGQTALYSKTQTITTKQRNKATTTKPSRWILWALREWDGIFSVETMAEGHWGCLVSGGIGPGGWESVNDTCQKERFSVWVEMGVGMNPREFARRFASNSLLCLVPNWDLAEQQSPVSL